MRGRLTLKRPPADTRPDDGKRRAGGATQPTSQPLASQPNGAGATGGWAAEFAAEVEQAAAEPRHDALPQSREPPAQQSLDKSVARQQPHRPPLQPDNADLLEVVPESTDEEDGCLAAGPRAAPAGVAMELELESPPSPAADEGTRQGLAKVADSLRRRVDAGRLQLEAQRRLLAQKQQLAAAGQAVLAQHCRASWQQAQQAQQGRLPGAGWHSASGSGMERLEPGDGAVVHSLAAECAAGQWWLQAVVSLPTVQRPDNAGSSSGRPALPPGWRLSLLATSCTGSLVCRQQQCVPAHDSDGNAASAGTSSSGSIRVQLTAALDVAPQQHQADQQQRQQQQQQLAASSSQQPLEVWADVFLLIEREDAVGTCGTASAGLAAPGSAPPVLLGRVCLGRLEWLRSHSRPPLLRPGQGNQQQQQQQQWQQSRALAVSSEQVDLACLAGIMQQQLGCMPTGGSSNSPSDSGGGSRSSQGGTGHDVAAQRYALPGCDHHGSESRGGAQAVPAPAAVSVRLYSRGFAEVHVHAGSTQLLDVLEEQLGQGLQAAAQAAGAPAGDARVEPSMLPAQRAQQAVGDALVAELDSSIEWVEALLKHKLALSSQHRRQRADMPPDLGAAAARAAQGQALTAMASTDASMISLLN